MPLRASCALRTGVLLSITQVKTQAWQHTSVTPVLGQGKTSVCGGRGEGTAGGSPELTSLPV